MTILLVILIYVFGLNAASSQICQNKTNKYLHQIINSNAFLNKSFTFFQNFNSFTDLYMDCNQTYGIQSSVVQFRPNRKLLIDETFSLTRLINSINLFNVQTLVMFNIKGIDLNSRAIESRHASNLGLVYSLVSVYSNSTLLNECSDTGRRNFLSSFKSIYFRQCIYPESLCTLIFVQSALEVIYFTDKTNSLLVKNRLRFNDSAA